VSPGISADELVTAARAATGRHELAALTLSAYDPSYDPDRRVRNAALAVLDALAPGIP
jgi:hypothetical protein